MNQLRISTTAANDWCLMTLTSSWVFSSTFLIVAFKHIIHLYAQYISNQLQSQITKTVLYYYPVNKNNNNSCCIYSQITIIILLHNSAFFWLNPTKDNSIHLRKTRKKHLAFLHRLLHWVSIIISIILISRMWVFRIDQNRGTVNAVNTNIKHLSLQFRRSERYTNNTLGCSRGVS